MNLLMQKSVMFYYVRVPTYSRIYAHIYMKRLFLPHACSYLYALIFQTGYSDGKHRKNERKEKAIILSTNFDYFSSTFHKFLRFSHFWSLLHINTDRQIYMYCHHAQFFFSLSGTHVCVCVLLFLSLFFILCNTHTRITAKKGKEPSCQPEADFLSVFFRLVILLFFRTLHCPTICNYYRIKRHQQNKPLVQVRKKFDCSFFL